MIFRCFTDCYQLKYKAEDISGVRNTDTIFALTQFFYITRFVQYYSKLYQTLKKEMDFYGYH
jgi:hypothetical protein